MLSRFLRYAERRYDLKWELASVGDRRQKRQIPTFRVLAGLFFMGCARVGGLNAIEEALRRCLARCVWHQWLGGQLPSGDRLGEVEALLDVGQLRSAIIGHYLLRRRFKTLLPPGHTPVLAGPAFSTAAEPSTRPHSHRTSVLLQTRPSEKVPLSLD